MNAQKNNVIASFSSARTQKESEYPALAAQLIWETNEKYGQAAQKITEIWSYRVTKNSLYNEQSNTDHTKGQSKFAQIT